MSPAAPELPAGAEGLGLRAGPLFEEHSEDCRLAGYVSGDGMKGYLLIERRPAELRLDAGALLEKLRARGMVFGLNETAVRQCLDRAAGRSGAQLMEVAEGRPPEHGADGQIEFYVQPSSEEARYTRDAAGRVNYHELNLIENVAAGQELARLLPPKPGAPGSTVLGEELPPRTGQSARARAGRGVRAGGAGGDLFIAEFPGRLVHAGEVLSISQEYEVKGNVDYSVGNVDFVGRVVIHGEVLDEFNVRGEMGLTVRGAVGKCQLVSAGDVALTSGISGKGAGAIRAGGRVRARYLNEVTVEAGGDVQVERESYNAVVRTAGSYRGSGKVVGGEVMALEGIETDTAGSELGVATRLVAGADYRHSGRVRELNETAAALDKEIDRVSTAIGPLLADPQKVAALPPGKKRVILDLVSHLRALKERREDLAAQMQQAAAADAAAVRQINIRKRLFSGVSVELGPLRLLVKSPSTGPLSLLEDPAGGGVRITAYAPLGVPPAATGGAPGGRAPR